MVDFSFRNDADGTSTLLIFGFRTRSGMVSPIDPPAWYPVDALAGTGLYAPVGELKDGYFSFLSSKNSSVVLQQQVLRKRLHGYAAETKTV